MSVKPNRLHSRPSPLFSSTPDRQSGGRPVLHRVIASACLAVISLLTTTVHADVYRWVEADGTVNYGERAPRNLDYTVISRSAPPPNARRASSNRNPSANANQTPAANQNVPGQDTADNLSDRQRAMLERLQDAEQVRQAEIAKIRESNCATSRRVLSNMQARGRIRVRTEDGGEVAMSDDERNERIRQAQESIAVNCDSVS